MNKNLSLSAALLAAITPAGAKDVQKMQRPNIIFIMCDDMGYGDLGCYGQQYISTPNIDRMASQGMMFTQAYAGAPVSAPSRATVMTGQHTGHTEVRGNKEFWPMQKRVKYGKNEEPVVTGQLPYLPGHIILPEIMKKAGYSTGMFGKWAGGYEGSCSTPDKRGIDEYYGYICQFQAHAYYPDFLNSYSRSNGDTAVKREILEENIRYSMNGREYLCRTQYSADLIHRKAMDWLERQDGDKPFFGIFTYTIPHAELAQPDDSLLEGYKKKFFWDRTWGGDEASRYHASEHVHAQFAAMISRLDIYVGEILAELKKKNLDDNTIVIFTSDNGPHEEGGADPEFFGRDGKLRGLKRQCYEGGIRIPFIVRWPGHIMEGQREEQPIVFYDILPTFCDLAGIKGYPQKFLHGRDDTFDGISFCPTLTHKGVQQQHKYLYWEFSETDQFAVRMGYWKLIVRKGVPSLYNLAADLHEDHDVAADHPDIVRQLVSFIFKEHRDSKYFPITMPED